MAEQGKFEGMPAGWYDPAVFDDHEPIAPGPIEQAYLDANPGAGQSMLPLDQFIAGYKANAVEDAIDKEIDEKKVSGALLSQRAILSSEFFWGIRQHERGEPEGPMG